MFFLFALFSCSKRYKNYPVNHKPVSNGKIGRVNCTALNVRTGPSTTYTRVAIIYSGTQVKVYSVENGWAKIDYNGDERYCCASYLDIYDEEDPSPSGWPPANPVRMGNKNLNSNINKDGSAFLSCCWLGKKNSVSEIIQAYNTAINRGAMASDCYIKSWNSMKCITGANSYRYGSKNEQISSYEKEILICSNLKISNHYVVGNGNGNVEYDPLSQGTVSYSDHTSKIIYSY